MTNEYENRIVVLNEANMQTLKDGQPIYVDGDECNKPFIILTEKGFKNFSDFLGEEYEDAT